MELKAIVDLKRTEPIECGVVVKSDCVRDSKAQ